MIGKLTLLVLAIGMAAMGKGRGRRRGGQDGNAPDLETVISNTNTNFDYAEHGSSSSLPDGTSLPHRSSGWNTPNAWSGSPQMRAARREMDNLGDLPPMREQHILHGDLDDPTSGGHFHDSEIPGKTKFPQDWDEDRVVEAVKDVANNPDGEPVERTKGGWQVTGQRDGVNITVVLNKDGTIWTAHPTGGMGVTKNPG